MQKPKTKWLITFLLWIGGLSINIYAQESNDLGGDRKLPQHGFIENRGQIKDQFKQPNKQVRYLLPMDGLNVQLRTGGFSYDTYVRDAAGNLNIHRVDIEIVNANRSTQLIPLKASEDVLNYYTSGVPQGGITNVRNYGEIIYKNIYDGIDLVFKAKPGTDRAVEYDFIVHPGADPSQIKLKYNGAFNTQLVAGRVSLSLAHGNLFESIPESYLAETEENILVAYHQLEADLIAFHVPHYDNRKTLVIDPSPNRDWATYYGGTAADDFKGVAVDGSNNVYVVGATASAASIATAGAHQATISTPNDAMVIKFNSSGSRLWATYYGGDGNDYGSGIALDASANVYVVGQTYSTNNIATTGAFKTTLSGVSDIYLVKFNTSGTRQFGTYFGGTGEERATAIAVSGTNVYVGGYTTSTSGVASTGAYLTTLTGNAFVANFSTTGTRTWSTYYPGREVYAIRVDGGGNILFGGETPDLTGVASAGAHQTTFGGGAYDGFLVKFNSGGARLWGTYLGGGGQDRIRTIAVNAANAVYVGGATASTSGIGAGSIGGLPQTFLGGTTDGFINQFNSSGVRQWGMYVGTTAVDEIFSINVRPDNAIFYGGTTTGALATTGAYQTTNGGGNDFFIGKFDPLFSNYDGFPSPRLWASNYGGTGADMFYGMALSGNAAATKMYLVGTTTSSTVVASAGSHQTTIGGGQDGLLAAFTDCGMPGKPGAISLPATICAGQQYTITVGAAYNATSYEWVLPAGMTGSSTTNSINVTVTSGGTINVRAVNACGNSPYSTITASITPLLGAPGTISGSASICQGTSQSYSISALAGASSYTWTLPSGWSGTSTTTTINTTVGPSTGTISVAGNNACGVGATRTLNVSVTPLPVQPSVITGDAVVCQGASKTFSVTHVSGNTYAWTLPAGWSGSSTSSSITATVGSSGGTISVTPSNSCGTGPVRTFSVSVANGSPLQPGAITGNATVCSGSSQTYSIAPVAGATAYGWNVVGTGWSGVGTGTSFTATAGTGNATIYVYAVNACGSSSDRTFSVTTVTSPAQPSAISGNGFACAGSTHTYSVTNIAGVTYNWTLPSGWTGSSTTNSITVVTGSNSGTISVTASNSCGTSSVRTLAVTVGNVPAMPTVSSAPSPVCQGSNTTYSINPVPGADGYTWTLPSGWSGTSISQNISATVGASGGNILVTANSNDCGASQPLTIPVTVNPVPATPGLITGNASVCQGSSNTYSVAAVTGATSYTWTLPSGWSGTSTANSITATAGASGGNITVRANNSCGASANQTLAITANPLPSQPGGINGYASYCQGTELLFSLSPASAANATSYTWTLPAGWSGSSTTNTITATVGVSGGTISVTANNSCGSSAVRTLSVASVTALPAQPGAISGNTTICSGSSNTYSISAVSGATSYTWTLPSGWSGTSTATSITPTASATSGDIIVTANNSCGSSNQRTLAVTVNSIPVQPSTITGATTVCQGTTQTYSVTNVAGVTYNWTAPGGTITGSGNSVSITWNSLGAQTVSVTPTNSCGTGTARALSVTVNSGSALAQPGAISGNASICSGTSQTYSIGAVSGATSYTWTLPGGWSGTSASTSITATVGSSGTISVAANNSCGSSTAQTLTVTVNSTPAQPGTISGVTTACQSSSQVYSVGAVSGATSYTWTLPSGWSGTSSTNSITATVGASSGNISVTASNTCGTSTVRTLTVSVNATPAQPSVIAGVATVCQGVSQNYSVTNVGGVTYTWSAGTGGVVTGSGNSVNISWSSSGSKTVQVTPSNGCGAGTVRTLNVEVITTPAQPSVISGSATVEVTDAVNYSVTNVAGTTYQWSLPSLGTLTPSGNSASVTWTGAGSATLSVTPSNACGSGPVRSLAVTVSKKTQTITFPAIAAKVFGEANFNVNATTNSGLPLSYSSSNTSVATISSAGVVTIVGAGSTNITASQGGDATYLSATPVTRTLVVNKANQTITFATIPTKSVSDPPFTLSATASSGLAVSYTSSNTAVATVSGSTITIVGAGATTLTASQSGNANFNAATSVQQTLTVLDQNRNITLAGDMNFGEVIIGEPLTKTLTISNSGNASVIITNITYPTDFTGDITNGTVNPGSTLELSITFTPTESKSYSGNITVTSNANSGSSVMAVNGMGVTITSTDNPIVSITQVYPNPAVHELFVELSKAVNEQERKLTFYDAAGKPIVITLEPTFEAGKYRCDVSSLKAGLYLMALPGQKNMTRIIKTN
jgi:hypothetical protein